MNLVSLMNLGAGRPVRRGLACALTAILLLAGCGTGAGDEDQITVGVSGAFAENQIVAEMYAQVLENAGYRVDRQMELGARDISQAALNVGELHVVPEYLASLLLFLDPDAAAGSDGEENASQIRELLEDSQLALLEPSEADDTNAFVVTAETAAELDLERVSDLAPVAGDLVLGGPPECPERPFCILGLEDVYGVTFGEFRPLDAGGTLTVAALEGGEIDVALLFSTSSVIQARNFVMLEDDQGLQAAENITPLVRRDVLTDEVELLLNEVSAQLTTANITELNARVEIDGEDPADVARAFLQDRGLI